MTDAEQEGGLPVEELQAPEVQEVSTPATDVQQPSVPEATGLTEDRLIEILAERDETASRKAQSQKDRGISNNAKAIAAILERFDELGGDEKAANDLVQEADTLALRQTVEDLQSQIQAGQTAAPAPTGAAVWQDEWAVDSQKILDAAEVSGVVLSNEDYNLAMHNNGIAFATKADAYAALNGALLAKQKGESMPVSVVSTEGGEVAQPPAPPAEPKPFRQQFDELNDAGDTAGARALLDEQWKLAESDTAKANARRAAEAAGLTLAE
ncbi:hypothetical protein LCGC14_0984590 [marine sediment metagenome]|uniref:Uncharacterized protein n=1 Tax=marine sediment metagenome TaxID=412755 RepID=A0A0F9NC45_9ZZZZ